MTGWRAIVLAPILIPLGLIARLLPIKKSEDRSPEDVAGYLRDFIEGTGGDWDWDEFESVPITDPALDRVRREAAMAGPPGPDFVRLRILLAEVEGMISVPPHPSASG